MPQCAHPGTIARAGSKCRRSPANLCQPRRICGTDAARQLLRSFFSENRDRYHWQLSYPIAEATTGLSPHLKFGVISIRECYQPTEVQLKGITDRSVQRTRKQLISRLRWGSGFAQRFRYLPQLELRLNFRSRAIYSSFLSHLLGMDWRYGALHFMQHLIDDDCPIDHW